VAGALILYDMGFEEATTVGTVGFVFSVAALMVFVVFAPLTLIAVSLVRAFHRERRRRRDMTVRALPQSAR
jgi:membrane protein implicated in regulation of membrane protease activity